MKRVKYVGDMSPIKIKILGGDIHWKRGEIKELSDKIADKLLELPKFSRVGGKKKKEEPKEEEEEQILKYKIEEDD